MDTYEFTFVQVQLQTGGVRKKFYCRASGICSLFLRKIVVSSASWLIISLWLFISNPLMFEFITVLASN